MLQYENIQSSQGLISASIAIQVYAAYRSFSSAIAALKKDITFWQLQNTIAMRYIMSAQGAIHNFRPVKSSWNFHSRKCQRIMNIRKNKFLNSLIGLGDVVILRKSVIAGWNLKTFFIVRIPRLNEDHV